MEKDLILPSVFAQTEAKLRTAENQEGKRKDENEKQKMKGIWSENIIWKNKFDEQL